jgi:hypothetical protein
LERGALLDWYLLKSGIFAVEEEALAKGLAKVGLVASATPLRCWQEATAARVVGSCWRAQARSREVEAEERDMANDAIAVNCRAESWGRTGEGGGRAATGRKREDFLDEVEVGGPAATFASDRNQRAVIG